MVFNKKCPLCSIEFLSLVSYMEHIKNNHSKEHPERFVEHNDEIKWSFRNND